MSLVAAGELPLIDDGDCVPLFGFCGRTTPLFPLFMNALPDPSTGEDVVMDEIPLFSDVPLDPLIKEDVAIGNAP